MISTKAKVFDFDGVLSDYKGTMLAKLARDYVKTKPNKHYRLMIRGLTVSYFMKLQKAFLRNFKHSLDITGETSSLTLFDILFLEKAKIPVSFMEKQAKEYAKFIPDKTRDALKNSEYDLYLSTNEPTDFIELILSGAGILDCFTEIKGNKFDIREGVIVGFDRNDLKAGSKRKNSYVRDLNLQSKYDSIDALGDSRADIGMYIYSGHVNSKVRLYAIETASQEFKQFVGKERTVKSIAEFLYK